MRHPECQSSRENRDTVFCQMRRAMDLIHYVIKEGVLDTAACLGPDEGAAAELHLKEVTTDLNRQRRQTDKETE